MIPFCRSGIRPRLLTWPPSMDSPKTENVETSTEVSYTKAKNRVMRRQAVIS